MGSSILPSGTIEFYVLFNCAMEIKLDAVSLCYPKNAAILRLVDDRTELSGYAENPVSIKLEAQPFTIRLKGGLAFTSEVLVTALVSNLGVVTFTYTIKIPEKCTLEQLAEISYMFSQEEFSLQFEINAEHQLKEFITRVASALEGPIAKPLRQTYVVFAISGFSEPVNAETLLQDQRELLAKLIRQEPPDVGLSTCAVDDALSCSYCWYNDSLVLADRDVAFLTGRCVKQVLPVIWIAQVQRLELAYLQRLVSQEHAPEAKRLLSEAEHPNSKPKSLMGIVRTVAHGLWMAISSPWSFGDHRGPLSRTLFQVSQLEVDAKDMINQAMSAVQFYGDATLASIYERLTTLYEFERTRTSIEDYQVGIKSIVQILTELSRSEHTTFLEKVVIGLIEIEIVLHLVDWFLAAMGYLPH